MKKIIGLLALTGALAFTACTNSDEVKKEKTVVTTPATVEKTPEKSTTVILDKNGVQVGTKKVNVSVKK